MMGGGRWRARAGGRSQPQKQLEGGARVTPPPPPHEDLASAPLAPVDREAEALGAAFAAAGLDAPPVFDPAVEVREEKRRGGSPGVVVAPALQGGINAFAATYIKDLRVAVWSIIVKQTSVAQKGRCHFSQVAQRPFQVSRNRLLLARNLWR